MKYTNSRLLSTFFISSCFFLIWGAISSSSVFASIVRLDRSFGGLGYIKHHDAGGGNNKDLGSGIIKDKDGKYVVTGMSNRASNDYYMTVWRYNYDGTIDTTFNGTGYFTYVGAAGGLDDQGSDIVQLPNGKYLVCGSSEDGAGEEDVVVWRLNKNGTLDTSFNGTGFVTHNNAAGGNGNDSCASIALQSDGKFILVGSSDSSPTTINYDTVVWRFNADGSLDQTFGDPLYPCVNGVGVGSSYGCVVHDGAAGGSGNDVGSSVEMDNQGRLLIAGYSMNVSHSYDMAVWRINSDGTFDTTFNSVGYATHGVPTYMMSISYDIAITEDDRYVIVGGVMPDFMHYDTVIWKYTTNGQLDTSFGGTGYIFKDYGVSGSTDDMFSVSIDDYGRYVVSGRRVDGDGNSDVAVWRFLDDGNLDMTFNDQGYIYQDNLEGFDDMVGRLLIDDDEKYVIVGNIDDAITDYDMAIWRFENLYQIDNFDSGLNAVVNEVSIESDTENGVYGGYEVTVDKGGIVVAKILTDMIEDRDWSEVKGDTDLTNYKSYMHGITDAPGTADTFILYVPRREGDTGVGICPEAESLDQVSSVCKGVYYLTEQYGNVTIDTEGGVECWVISGLTGTGGFSFKFEELPETGEEIFYNSFTLLLILIVLVVSQSRKKYIEKD